MRITSFLLIFSCLIASTALAEVPGIEKPIATLRALNKITARVEEIDIPTTVPYKFGTIDIVVRSCRVTPPEVPPEAAAFLNVKEKKVDQEEEVLVFDGWMFASSPALSAMEHPVYDLWLIGCKEGKNKEVDAKMPELEEVIAP